MAILFAQNPIMNGAIEATLEDEYRKRDVPSPRSTNELSQIVRCHQCEKDFDMTENGRRICRWHPGKGLRGSCLQKPQLTLIGKGELWEDPDRENLGS
jgi:hypothetical protein